MFKKRETITQNIAFMSIIAAINVVLITIATLLPIISPFIILLLPFLSVSVTLTCKNKYYPIYAIATLGVAMAATFFNNEMTLFYLFPSLISGLIFGIFIKYKINPLISLLTSSIIQCFLSIALIYLNNFIYSTDFINSILKMLNLDKKENVKYIILSFIFFFSFVQELLSYLIINKEIVKFYELDENENITLLLILDLTFSILTIPFLFFALSFSYLFMIISLIISTYFLSRSILNKNIISIIFIGVFYLSGFILVFALFNFIKMPYLFLLINISNILILAYTFIYNLVERKKENA